MKSSTLFFAVLLAFNISLAQINPQAVQKDPADKVLLATDTVALGTKNLEKENSETVKTQNHPKITRQTKTVKKGGTASKKRKAN